MNTTLTLVDCTVPGIAAERAADLLAATTRGGDRDYWEAQAHRVLTALLHAAGLGGLTMSDVDRWLTDLPTAAGEITRLLRLSTTPVCAIEFTRFIAANERTRTYIIWTIRPTSGWPTSLRGPHPSATTAPEYSP